jgi:hypothetical protein
MVPPSIKDRRYSGIWRLYWIIENGALRTHPTCLILPQLCYWSFFAAYVTMYVSQTSFAEQGIEFFVGVDLQQGCQEIAWHVTRIVLHSPFFVSLSRHTIIALKQVIAAKGFERGLFLTVMSF